MRSLDTNLIVRLVVKDDEPQRRAAARLWRDSLTTGGIFLATAVIIEVAWVVRAAYGFDRAAIAQAIRRLVGTEGVVVEHPEPIRRALDAFEHGSADFSDYVILESARAAGALPLFTFDERLSREADVSLVAAAGD